MAHRAGVVVLSVALLAAARTTPAAPDAAAGAHQAKAFIRRILAESDVTERVRALVGKLGRPERAVREAATRELIALGEPALPIVRDATRDDDPEVRGRAERVLEAYRAAPRDESHELTRAIDAVAAAKDRWIVAALIALLGHPRTDVRYAAEYGLRRIARHRFGYNAYAGKDARAAAGVLWRMWWRDAEAIFVFHDAPPVPPKVAGIFHAHQCKRTDQVLGLKGKLLWSRKKTRPIVATPLPSGRLLYARRGSEGTWIEECDLEGRVVWRTGNVPLKGYSFDVRRLVNGNTLAAHLAGSEVLEFDANGCLVWRRSVERPMSAERLPNGTTLVAVGLRRRGRVVELSRAGREVWSIPNLQYPMHAVALEGGRVLVAEYGARRVVEFDRDGQVVWERTCAGRPTCVLRLPDGTTALTDTAEGLILIGNRRRIFSIA